MENLINDLDKKISKAQNITGNLFNDLKEIRTSFNKLKEAISVTRSCCKLKDKETITFQEYLKEQGWEQVSSSFIYKQGNNYKDREEIRKEYIKKIYNL
jgi:hypothetical protein